LRGAEDDNRRVGPLGPTGRRSRPRKAESNVNMEIKTYTDADFAEYLRLRNELDVHGQVESAEDLRAELSLPWVKPEEDVFLVFDKGAGVGCAAVRRNSDPGLNRHYFDISLIKELQKNGPFVDELINLCEERIKGISAERGETAVQIRAFCYDENKWLADGYERNGYELIRYYARMDLNDPGTLKEPDAREGVTIRNFERERETPAFVEALNRGFDGHFEHTPEPPENFDVYFNTHWYRPDLVFVAETGGELVGVCWTLMMLERQADGLVWGVVEDLAVVPEWRGKGLGRGLLRRGQLALRGAGAEKICLWVDYANPFGAKKLYYSEGYVDRYITRSYAKDEKQT